MLKLFLINLYFPMNSIIILHSQIISLSKDRIKNAESNHQFNTIKRSNSISWEKLELNQIYFTKGHEINKAVVIPIKGSKFHQTDIFRFRLRTYVENASRLVKRVCCVETFAELPWTSQQISVYLNRSKIFMLEIILKRRLENDRIENYKQHHKKLSSV